MAALTQDRNTPEITGVIRDLGVAAGAVIHAGALICLSATGFATPGAVATTLTAVGRAEEAVDNTAGPDGAVTARIKRGIFHFANSAAGDLITIADIGGSCFIVDDQTVAKTDALATRSVAGKIINVDAQGVWVEVG